LTLSDLFSQAGEGGGCAVRHILGSRRLRYVCDVRSLFDTNRSFLTLMSAFSAAIELASRPGMEGKRIVCIIPSFGERYLSTALFQNLLDESQVYIHVTCVCVCGLRVCTGVYIYIQVFSIRMYIVYIYIRHRRKRQTR
jgi:hypothetical protein